MECNACNRMYVWWINRHIRKQEANIRSSHELEQQKGGAAVEPEDYAAEEQSLTAGGAGTVEQPECVGVARTTAEPSSVVGSGGYGATVAAQPTKAKARAADAAPASHQNVSNDGSDERDGDDYYAEGGAFYSHIKSSEVEFFSHEEGEFFFHVLSDDVFVREEAEAGAPRVGEAPLEKGRVYEGSERLQQGERVFFKLARDGEGWRAAAVEGGASDELRPRDPDPPHDPPQGWVEGGSGAGQVLEEVPEPYFMYRVRAGYRVHARADPDMNAKQVSRSVQGGELFEECQQRRQQDGQVFLRLPDFSGWVFKVAANGDQVLDRVPQLPRRLKAKTKLAARVMPDIFSGRTGKIFEEDAELGISRRIAADDRMQVFYKLADGSGWVFKHSAQGEQMLTELQPPKGAEDCVIM